MLNQLRDWLLFKLDPSRALEGAGGFSFFETGDTNRVSIRSLPSYLDPSDSEFASLQAEALVPYKRASQEQMMGLIDPTILAKMRTAEKAMEENGDVLQGFLGRMTLGLTNMIVVHEDEGVERAYREAFERANLMYTLQDAWMDCDVYGNAYTVVIGSGQNMTAVNFNPKHIAVGRQVSLGQRPVIFFPGSRDPSSLNDVFVHQQIGADWNEWQDIGKIQGAYPLNPNRVIHTWDFKLHHQRYSVPPITRAWPDIIKRAVLDELIMKTAEGVKTQTRLWKLENPGPAEIELFRQKVIEARTSRVADFVWRGNVQVTELLPGVIDVLMGNESYLRFTRNIFRKLGLTLRFVTGEPVYEEASGRTEADTEVKIALGKIRFLQNRAATIAQRFARIYASAGDSSLGAYPAPTIYFAPSVLSATTMMDITSDLLKYGGMSMPTALEFLNIDPDSEIARIKRTMPLRDEGVIRPYASYSQESDGRVTESVESPGRPPGADRRESTSRTNRRNATGVKDIE